MREHVLRLERVVEDGLECGGLAIRERERRLVREVGLYLVGLIVENLTERGEGPYVRWSVSHGW